METTRASHEHSVAFSPFEVECAESLLETVDAREALQRLSGQGIEAIDDWGKKYVAGVSTHPLVTAVALAFGQHRPLVLSPEAIWLTILQGVAMHVEENWNELRTIVTESRVEKRVLEVSTEHFLTGSPENDWRTLIEEAASQAFGAVKEPYADLFQLDFSSSSNSYRIAAKLTFLSSIRQYLSVYDRVHVCGIPSITVLGTADDYKRMNHHLQFLDSLKLGWWRKELVPIVDEFVCASNGQPRIDFWRQIFTTSDPRCGQERRVTGWIGKLYPFTTKNDLGLHRNPLFDHGEPPDIPAFPLGVRELCWERLPGQMIRFLAGFIGIEQSSDGALQPSIGWGVQRQTAWTQALDACLWKGFGSVRQGPNRTRPEIPVAEPAMALFYSLFSDAEFKSSNGDRLRLLPVEEFRIVRKRPPIYRIGEILKASNERQWLGLVSLTTMDTTLALLHERKRIPVAWFVGDDATIKPGGVARIITNSFQELIYATLHCCQNGNPIALESLGYEDPQCVEAVMRRLGLVSSSIPRERN